PINSVPVHVESSETTWTVSSLHIQVNSYPAYAATTATWLMSSPFRRTDFPAYTAFMRRSVFLCFWLCIPPCFGQNTTIRPDVAPVEDPLLHAEAVRLLERAVMLTTPVWPANEEFANFRVLHPAPGEASEGSIKIGVRTPVNKRWEFTYGNYKLIRVQDG